jgi:hypothetical protein
MLRQPGHTTSDHAKNGTGIISDSLSGTGTTNRLIGPRFAEFLKQWGIIWDRRRRITLARKQRTFE